MSAHQQRAWAALERSRYDLAEQEFRLVLTEDPDDAQAHAGLALCLSEQKKYDEAEAEAKAAVGLAPDIDFCHFALGRVLFERNHFPEAIAAAEEAIRLDPQDANNRYLLAMSFSRQRKWSGCLDVADAGLAIDPEHEGCTNLRALSLTHLGQKDQASDTIAGALERSPESSLTHTNQGWALLHRNDPNAALEHFREALRLDPTNDWAREGLLTALKASNTFYRGVLAFFLYMQRKGEAARWMIIIGILVGQQVLFRIGDGDSPAAWAAFVVAILATIFVALTWLANPLMNLLMRFHPHGRHALTQEQRTQSTLIALCLLSACAFFIGEVVTRDRHMISLMMLLLALPVLLIHLSEEGWPRRVAALVAGVFLLAALQVTVAWHLLDILAPVIGTGLTDGMVAVAKQILGGYFWAILIWSLAGNQLIAFIPRR
ncbi:MAG: tetratricopeptide repeat protein [Planctomycetes bacterium]|jgi:tetratricopeptide (TPR) repeat protein|nr:tetratricopeptide repeat protein [Planctomycetota bacterium]